jgi:hypothetical protein
MGSHLFTSRSGLNLGIRMRKKQQHIFTVSLKNAAWLETLVDLLSAMQFLASAMRHSA